MNEDRTRNPFAAPTVNEVRAATQPQAAFLTQAFGWMFVGLLVTAGVTAWVQASPTLHQFAQDWIFAIIILQLGLVITISAAVNRIGATAALGLFFVYAASVGLTVGLIVSLYTTGSAAVAFLSASAMFGAAAVYGATTKRSLAALRGILFMGLIGLLVAMVVNLFLGSSQVTWLISVVGVVIFTALTAYDVQRIGSGQLAERLGSVEKAAVIGALSLYLDFINLFLFLLRLFGSGRS